MVKSDAIEYEHNIVPSFFSLDLFLEDRAIEQKSLQKLCVFFGIFEDIKISFRI